MFLQLWSIELEVYDYQMTKSFIDIDFAKEKIIYVRCGGI